MDGEPDGAFAREEIAVGCGPKMPAAAVAAASRVATVVTATARCLVIQVMCLNADPRTPPEPGSAQVPEPWGLPANRRVRPNVCGRNVWPQSHSCAPLPSCS